MPCGRGFPVMAWGVLVFSRVLEHGLSGAKLQRQKTALGGCLSGNFERQRLLTAHAMQRKRGKKRFNVVVPLLLLFGVLCQMVRFLVVFMVSNKDKTYSLHNCTQGT